VEQEPRVSLRLELRVRRDFAGDAAEVVLQRLAALRPPMAEKQSIERIQAAVVLLAHGELDSFEHAAERAEIDWRDVLVWSGLAGNWRGRLDEELGGV
jgi:hypothetical protein